MKFRIFLPFLAIAAGALSSCDDSMPTVETTLTVSPASQEIGEDGTASVVFTVRSSAGKDIKADVSLQSAGGFTSPAASGVTDANGNLSVKFTAKDLEYFVGGTVTATVSVVSIDGVSSKTYCVATAEILPRGTAPGPPADSPIKVAEALKDNTYAVQKKGGSAQIFSLSEEESRWYVGTSNIDRTKQVVSLIIPGHLFARYARYGTE